MAESRETRSQALLKESVARETEVAVVNRYEERTQALEASVSTIGDNLKEIFDFMKRMEKGKAPAGPSTSGGVHIGDHSPVHSMTPDIQRDHHMPNLAGMYGNNNRLTRLAKIEFTKFDGDKVEDWLSSAEQFFVIDNTAEEAKVAIASLHFTGVAKAWHKALVKSEERNGLVRNWQIYKILLKERFEEVLDDLIAELKELKETDGIVDYHAKFELIRARLTMSEEYLMSAYLAGLRIDTQMHVRMFNPQTTRQCLVLGRLYEKAHPKKPFNSTWSNQKTTPAPTDTKGILPWKPKEAVKPKEGNQKMKPFLSNAEND